MKSLTLVCSVYASEKYLKNFLVNVDALINRNDIVLVLVMNDPNPNELSIVNDYYLAKTGEMEIISVDREPISKSINRGFRFAETEFVAYLDVDDTHPPDAYELMIRTLGSHEITYGDYLINDVLTKQTIYHECKQFDKDLAYTEPLFGPTHCFRRNVLDRLEYWDEQLKSVGDYEWQIRASRLADVKKTNGLITFYTKAADSASKTKWHHIENLLLSLRYCKLDKIGGYINYAGDLHTYNINCIQIDDRYIPISSLIGDPLKLSGQSEVDIIRGFGVRKPVNFIVNNIINKII